MQLVRTDCIVRFRAGDTRVLQQWLFSISHHCATDFSEDALLDAVQLQVWIRMVRHSHMVADWILMIIEDRRRRMSGLELQRLIVGATLYSRQRLAAPECF